MAARAAFNSVDLIMKTRNILISLGKFIALTPFFKIN